MRDLNPHGLPPEPKSDGAKHQAMRNDFSERRAINVEIWRARLPHYYNALHRDVNHAKSKSNKKTCNPRKKTPAEDDLSMLSACIQSISLYVMDILTLYGFPSVV